MNPPRWRAWMPWTGWLMLLPAVLLSVVGIAGIYAGEAGSDAGPANTLRQLTYVVAGLLAFLMTYLLGYARIGRWSYLLYGLVLVLLALLVVGRKVPLDPIIKAKRHACRWIDIGPVQLQVSEPAKIVLVLALARHLRFRQAHRRLRGLMTPLLLTIVPMGLILAEPDLGTSLLFLPVCLIMIFAAGARLRHLALLAVVFLIGAPAFFFSPLMSPYQRQRIQVLFRQDDNDTAWQMSAGYQLRQSKTAMGSGGWFGRGLSQGSFFRHKLLPEGHNDFILAVLGHQWGFSGCAALLACYLLIMTAAFTAASAQTDPFARLLAVGIAAMLGVQAFVNAGMTMGLLPITGLTLPFVSAGGSGLVTNFTMIGLAASVARKPPVSIAPRSFEFAEKKKVFA